MDSLIKILFFVSTLIISIQTSPTSSDQLTSRVYGGINGLRQEYAFLAMCSISKAAGTFLCGGSLIHKKWIITAAHCVDSAISATIKLGTTAYTANSSDPGYTYSSTYFIVHESYVSGKVADDIGLVRLTRSALFDNTVRPIKLASNDKQLYVARFATSCGWGITSQGNTSPSSQMKCADFLAIDNTECINTYGNIVLSSMLCARGLYSGSTCKGDSGGALVMEPESVLAGIVSFGVADGCNLNYPNAFTRITSYLDWVYTHTGINSSYIYQEVY